MPLTMADPCSNPENEAALQKIQDLESKIADLKTHNNSLHRDKFLLKTEYVKLGGETSTMLQILAESEEKVVELEEKNKALRERLRWRGERIRELEAMVQDMESLERVVMRRKGEALEKAWRGR